MAMTTRTNRTTKTISWDDNFPDLQKKNLFGSYYGFEMECDVVNNPLEKAECDEKDYDEWNDYAEYDNTVFVDPTSRRRKYKMIATEDCSLQSSGCEFVTLNPVSLKVLTKGNWLKSTLENLVHKTGVQEGTQPKDYGLHISVNMNGWSYEHALSFLTAVNMCMLSKLTTKLRERTIEWASYSKTTTALNGEAWKKYKHELATNHHIKAYDSGYSHPLDVNLEDPYMGSLPEARQTPAGMRYRSPACEIRGFQMTTDLKTNQARIDFVESMKFASRKYSKLLLDLATGVTKNVTVEQYEAVCKLLMECPPIGVRRNYTKPLVSRKAKNLLVTIKEREQDSQNADYFIMEHPKKL